MDKNRLANINQWVNSVIPYDGSVGKVTNTLADAMNGGQCRDYAKWKASTALMAGADRNNLKILYGLIGKTPHSVLAYYPPDGGEPLILDNLSPEVLPLSKLHEYAGFESMPLPKDWK